MSEAEGLRTNSISTGQSRGCAIRLVAAAIACASFFAPGALADEPDTPGYGFDEAVAGITGFPVAEIQPNERMLVESDQLVYDYDNNTVSAVGNVKIYYAGYTLEAERVTYDQNSGRLIASGNVKLTDPTGANYYAQNFDITDDFRDGFVESLRVDTPQQTHFTAERAERSGGETTTFINGAYTACEPCKDRPEKPPLWDVKAAKIVVDHKEKTVYFTDARLEFFGTPVAWLPYFSVPDPSVRRKSGFLAPSVSYSSTLGFGAAVPYYWALAPNYDLTFTPTVYTNQGFLADVEWRHRLEHGQYSIRGAGIYQLNPDDFTNESAMRNWRGGVRTTGEFYLNQDWTLGWDGTLTSDKTFTRQYEVLNSNTSETTSTIHLTGLKDRNFFEARASYYEILTDEPTEPQYDQGRQAIPLTVDHKYYFDHSVFGGELTYRSNTYLLTRSEDDPFEVDSVTYYHGTEGNYVRTTKELAWERRFIGPLGQVITPFASIRGDAFYLDGSGSAAFGDPMTTDSTAYRFMPAVGVEWSMPVLATTGTSSHIVEPIAQLIVRPDEMDAGILPNNDAQSLVFDDSNLFDRDKFSGDDRVEGGTRLNVGFRYVGTFDTGASVDGLVGKSFNLAGTNPYATPDIADVGPFSGLETDRSDYVARVSLNTGLGPRLTARGRFDDTSFDINRAELEATTAFGPVTASSSYIYLRENPNSGVTTAASVLRGAASINFVENWRVFGTVTYDIAGDAIAGNSFGIAYDDECLTFSLAYSATRPNYTDIEPTQWVNLRVQLRTFGEAGVSTDLSRLQQ